MKTINTVASADIFLFFRKKCPNESYVLLQMLIL